MKSHLTRQPPKSPRGVSPVFARPIRSMTLRSDYRTQVLRRVAKKRLMSKSGLGCIMLLGYLSIGKSESSSKKVLL